MIAYDPRITIQRDRRVRSGGRVAYGKPINFAGMKKICMFVASYIQSGRVFCLFVAGIFLCPDATYTRFRTPVWSVNAPTAALV